MTYFPSPYALMGGKGVLLLITGTQMLFDRENYLSSNPLVTPIFKAFNLSMDAATESTFGVVGGLVLAFGSNYIVSTMQKSRSAAVAAVFNNLVFATSCFVGHWLKKVPDAGLFFGAIDLTFAILMATSLKIHKKKKSVKDE
ncbi:hypothetical protein HDU76_002846 [Blyttiomyces sp. JEL0837]|nr:hypothetical protein HDU76_002846 [Blyttiomyces sp. JEL0837]